MDLLSFVAKLTLDSSEYDSGLEGASQKASSIFDSMVKGGSTLSGIGTTLTQNITTPIMNGISELAEYGDSIDKNSQKIGISAKAYQEWDFILQHSGANINSLQTGMKSLRNAMDNASGATNANEVDTVALTKAQTSYNNALLEVEKAQISYNAAVEKYGAESTQAQKALLTVEQKTNKVADAEAKLQQVQEGTTSSLSEAGQALVDLGIKVTDANGHLRDEEDVFADLVTALQGMSNETERTRLATLLLGRSGTELGALLNTSAEDTEAMRQQVHELGGVMSDAAVKDSAAFQDSLQNMQTTFDGLKRSMLESFLPVFVQLMDVVAGVVSAFNGLDDNTKKVITTVGLALIAVGPVLTVIGNIITAIGTVGGAVTGIVSIVSGAGSAIGGVISGISSGVGGLFASLLANPTPIIVAGVIAAAGALLIYLVKNWDEIKEKAKQLGERLKEIWEDIGKAASAIWGTIVDTIISIITTLGESIAEIFSAIAETIRTVFEGLGDVLSAVWTGIVNVLTTIWKGLADTAKTIFNGIVEIVTAAWEGIETIVTEIWNGIIDILTDIWNGIVDLAKEVFSGVADVITTAWEGLEEVITVIWNGIVDTLTTIWTDLVDTAKIILGGIVDVISTAWSGIETIVSTIWNGIANLLKTIWNDILDAAKTVFNDIVDIIQTAWQGLETIVTTIWNSIVNAVKAIWDDLTSVASTIFPGISTIVTTAWNSLSETVSTIWNGIVTFLTDVWNGLVTLAQSTFEGITAIVRTIFEGILTLIETIWNSITNTISNSLDKIRKAADKLSDAFINLREKANDVWDSFDVGKTKSNDLIDSVRSLLDIIKPDLIKAVGEATDGIIELCGALKECIDNADSLEISFSNLIISIDDLNDLLVTLKKKLGDVSSALKTAKDALDKVNKSAKTLADTINNKVVKAFESVVDKAKGWGKDLLKNFEEGMKDEEKGLKRTLKEVAQIVDDYLGHSHPSKGPLAKDYLWMPDMMKLFARGIKDNKGLVEKQLEDTFDFSPRVIDLQYARHSYSGGYGLYGNSNQMGGGNSFNFTFNSPERLDPVSAAREAKKAAQQLALGYVG